MLTSAQGYQQPIVPLAPLSYHAEHPSGRPLPVLAVAGGRWITCPDVRSNPAATSPCGRAAHDHGMNKLRGTLAVFGAAAVISGAAWGVTSTPATPHSAHTTLGSIIGDKSKPATLTAAASTAAGPSCSWKERHVINLGNAGNIQVYLNTQSGCIWWARVTCETNGGTSTVVHDSSQADGEANRTAGCDTGTHPIHGGWRGAWNNVLHLDF